MKRSPKHIDLFAGCGGLSLGLEQAGFQPVFVNELSPDARGSYLLNRQNHFAYLSDPAFHCADVKSMVLDSKVLKTLKKDLKSTFGIDCSAGELDLIAGGPPCQGPVPRHWTQALILGGERAVAIQPPVSRHGFHN